MGSSEAEFEFVWSQFVGAGRPSSVKYLANHGGFSGAQLWRAQTGLGTLCLRAWPPGNPTHSQLAFVHRVLDRVGEEGLGYIPRPMRTHTGATFVRHQGRLWELTGWMPGSADFDTCRSRARLESAMRAVGQFHQAAAGCDGRVGPSPTLKRRLAELRSFWHGPQLAELRRQVPGGLWPQMDARAVRVLHLVDVLHQPLERLLNYSLPQVTQQPVIRDIWHDHVLFDGEQVSGIVDFGAMAVDAVAVDIARLLGSLVGSDQENWAAGLHAYAQAHCLPDEQRGMLEVLDLSGIFAGALVWLRWHYLEGRTFEDTEGVLARVDHFLRRLETLSERIERNETRFFRKNVTL